MSEMALTADRLIVVGRGRLIAEGGVEEVVAASSTGHVRVDTPEPHALERLLRDRGAHVEPGADRALISGKVKSGLYDRDR